MKCSAYMHAITATVQAGAAGFSETSFAQATVTRCKNCEAGSALIVICMEFVPRWVESVIGGLVGRDIHKL